jgi:ADP-ribosyl-[dinitrogen reductase] hydrolase
VGTDLNDRARGVLLGLAAGDALGGPLEFLSAADIRTTHGVAVSEMIGGGWLSLSPGHGTDDTAMTLGLARSSATSLGYVPRLALRAYIDWYSSGPIDVGNAISAALEGVLRGLSPEQATEAFHQLTGKSAGNGSVMRVAPIALRHLRDTERRQISARADSKLTHLDDHVAQACVWVCDAIAALLSGVDIAELLPPAELAGEWGVSREVAAAAAEGPLGGYVGTALGVASAAVRTAETFEEGLVWAVNLGGDTDTNGAVAGALLGARFGASAIPDRWLKQLLVADEAGVLAEQLSSLALTDGRHERSGGGSRTRSSSPPSTSSLDSAARLAGALASFTGWLEHEPESRIAAEAAISSAAVFQEGPMLVSNVPDRDVLYVHEREFAWDGLEPSRELEICEDVRLMFDTPNGRCVGFFLGGLSHFEFEAPQNAAIWTGPRFDIPPLGIEQGTVGLIAATVRLAIGGLRTPDRVLFDAALAAGNTEDALELWEACLQAGNELARYSLGYTLLHLDRPAEAHEPLKRYSANVRGNSWAWCYLGQACARLVDREGAEYAYRQALKATEAGSYETDAPERLARLLVRLQEPSHQDGG